MDFQVVIIGAGISGCLAAIELADAGYHVAIVDQLTEPMQAASRWNEGKIHLGYCYLGDASFASAKLMLQGASCFVPQIEKLCHCRLQDDYFSRPVIYVVDQDSQFSAGILWQRSQDLSRLILQLAEVNSGLRRYSPGANILQLLDNTQASELTGLVNFDMAWQTSELAIDPQPVARLIRQAVRERDIVFIQDSVQELSAREDGWLVKARSQNISTNTLINASWESRALLDDSVWPASESSSIRYKYAIFTNNIKFITSKNPSTRILGPYGDITPYGTGRAYISWYPDCLAGLSDDGIPPVIPTPDTDSIVRNTLKGLGLAPDLLDNRTSWQVKGGYVVAEGYGDIDNANSPLHSRSRVFVKELRPGYISVDTGKYTLGPLMAQQAVKLVMARSGQVKVR